MLCVVKNVSRFVRMPREAKCNNTHNTEEFIVHRFIVRVGECGRAVECWAEEQRRKFINSFFFCCCATATISLLSVVSVVVLLLLLSGYRAYFVHHCAGLGDCGKFSENFSASPIQVPPPLHFRHSQQAKRKLLETGHFALLLLPLVGGKEERNALKKFLS